jgi:hypothetical protein
VAAFGFSVMLVAGCAGEVGSQSRSEASARIVLERYIAQVEPVRLGVNRLLEGADPVLEALRERHISAAAAATRIGALERSFAQYTVAVSAIRPQDTPLGSLQAEYAETYVLEDAYLSALVSGLREHNLADLPNTQGAQRAMIIRWRTGLTVLAEEAHVVLPADLQRAGRGEIAPSPSGS